MAKMGRKNFQLANLSEYLSFNTNYNDVHNVTVSDNKEQYDMPISFEQIIKQRKAKMIALRRSEMERLRIWHAG
jgi:formate dehydrogenase maturation protein FdhE